MTNGNRKIVKDAENKKRKQDIHNFHSNNKTEFLGLFCITIYATMFVLISIINDSVLFSLLLALFSFATTLGFELVDWLKYVSNKSEKKPGFVVQLILRFHTNVCLLFVFFYIIKLSYVQ